VIKRDTSVLSNKLSPAANKYQMMLRICVEGNIGAGKTSAMNEVVRDFDFVRIYPEDVASMSSELETFYSSQTSDNARALELKILNICQRPYEASKKQIEEVALFERGPTSCTDIFSQYYKEKGILSPEHHTDVMTSAEEIGWKPDHYIYIQTSPGNAFDRMTRRSRSEEESVVPEYITGLHEQHERRFNPKNKQMESGLFIKTTDNVWGICGDQSAARVGVDMQKAVLYLANCKQKGVTPI